MSQPHQVAIVQVNAVMEETVRLADVLGRVPVDEIKEVLNSQWAKDKGWQTTGSDIYQRQITADVSMKFQIQGEEVKLTRKTSINQVKQTEASLVQGEKNRMLEEAKQEYNLAFNEVIAQALVKALPNRVKELNYELVEEPRLTVQQDNRVYELVMVMNV